MTTFQRLMPSFLLSIALTGNVVVIVVVIGALFNLNFSYNIYLLLNFSIMKGKVQCVPGGAKEYSL